MTPLYVLPLTTMSSENPYYQYPLRTTHRRHLHAVMVDARAIAHAPKARLQKKRPRSRGRQVCGPLLHKREISKQLRLIWSTNHARFLWCARCARPVREARSKTRHAPDTQRNREYSADHPIPCFNNQSNQPINQLRQFAGVET